MELVIYEKKKNLQLGRKLPDDWEKKVEDLFKKVFLRKK